MKIIVIGSGGREHALCWAIAKSPLCDELWCLPGNAGIAQLCHTENIAADDIDGLTGFITEKQADMVVVGPEVSLSLGIVDRLQQHNILSIGPTQMAAQLESSKIFTKNLCDEYNIPTAKYAQFDHAHDAVNYIRDQSYPLVIKADGLAAGKGVIIAQNEDEAINAINDMMQNHAFGDAGHHIIIEEFLEGEELSFFALCDGEHVLPLTSAQDHKKVGEGNVGPNTGGMGAYTPSPLCLDNDDDKMRETIMQQIIMPTIDGLKQKGINFQGILYAGLMIKHDMPYLIEYNVRFGDPECQAILMRLKSDIVALFHDCAQGKLHQHSIEWHHDSALTIVMASQGYPGSYQKGTKIFGLKDIEYNDFNYVFHAGTAIDDDGDIVAIGGRVLNVTAMAPSIDIAQENAYNLVSQIDWPKGFYRRDIGWRAIIKK